MSVQLMQGDCLELMRAMPSESIDAVVTDPPFGIGFQYESGREITNTPETYWQWLQPHYAEFVRLLKPGGFIAIWQTATYFKHFWSWYGDDIRIYAACKNFVQLAKTPINQGFDPVVMRYKGGVPVLRPSKPKRNLNFYVGNTQPTRATSLRLERGHPCPRPLDAVREVISNFVVEGGTVLDAFAGSGTTGVACVQTGRDFIGMEIEPKYFEIAKARIDGAQMPIAAIQQEAVPA